GSEHTVSFTSVQQNEQIVVVVEPGRLGVEADRPSVTAAPGETVPLTVRISRGKGLQGAVKLELIGPAHIKGISSGAVDVGADQNSGQLPIRFDREVPGPFNMALLLRATMMDQGKPVVAETKITVHPPR